jgi:hypothetical protein
LRLEVYKCSFFRTGVHFFEQIHLFARNSGINTLAVQTITNNPAAQAKTHIHHHQEPATKALRHLHTLAANAPQAKKTMLQRALELQTTREIRRKVYRDEKTVLPQLFPSS